MTQDYRERAIKVSDEWIESHLEDIEEIIGWEVKAKHVEHLYEVIEKALKEIAQEARRAAIEECAQVAMGSTGKTNIPELAKGYSGACIDIAKSIRALGEKE